MMKPFALMLLLLGLAGCTLMPAGRPQPVSHHLLTLPAAAPQTPPARPARAVLLVRETETPGAFQSIRLVYSRSPGTLNYYQYARWAETPSRALNAQLRQRLNGAGLYAAVVPLGAGVSADYQLNTRLQAFHHDASTRPGQARVSLEAELVSRSDARLVARQSFLVEAPVASYDARGAAVALGEASGQILDELTAWLARVQPVDAR